MSRVSRSTRSLDPKYYYRIRTHISTHTIHPWLLPSLLPTTRTGRRALSPQCTLPSPLPSPSFAARRPSPARPPRRRQRLPRPSALGGRDWAPPVPSPPPLGTP